MVDILHDHLARARASGGVFARSVVRPPWGLVLPGEIELTLHTVIRGYAWVWLADPATAIELSPGDLALVPGGPEHHIAHTPNPAHCVSHEAFWRSQQDLPEAELGTEHDSTVFMCGAYRFAGDIGRGLVEALPPILHLRPATPDRLHDVVAVLSRELAEPAPGRQTVLDRLLDVLLVLAMRASLAQSPTPPRWYVASADPRLVRALHAMHANPGHPWTVPELATLSAMSRPSFARQFERALGQTPMQYLTDWRLSLARDLLLAGELSLPQIAERTGYSSPNAFAAVFRRHVGRPPGQWRQDQLTKQPTAPVVG